MSKMHNLLSALIGLAASGVSAQSQPVVLQSTQKQTALLELFTSEGCSSCPPAESWLSGLKSSTRLWHDFVPVAFHVDYWDYLGWRDPWGSATFSDRQRGYAQSWRKNSVYTPGFVLDAKEWPRSEALRDGPRSEITISGVLKISSADLKRWQVSFIPAVERESHYAFYAALLANGVISDVEAGENRGRRLNHDFVVTALAKGSLETRNNSADGEITLAETGTGLTNRLAIAVWVTRVADPHPLQAVGGWLPAATPK